MADVAPSPIRAYLQSLELVGIKLGLEQIRALLDALDRPDRAYPSVLVAGTNGKGSVTAMAERGLRAAGLRTGRYTSPHLVHLEERFAINGVPVGAGELDAVASAVRAAADRLTVPPSYFEATTALALELFRRARVDVAVLEVGLGGRLDATNAVSQVITAITAIDFDHEAYLGHTIEAIAGEKAAVIKTDRPVVLGRNSDTVRRVVAEACARTGARLIVAPDDVLVEAQMIDGRVTMTMATPRARYGPMTLALRGRHQIDNAITAVRLLETLSGSSDLAIDIPNEAIVTALTEAEWPARLEVVRWLETDVLIDGAHNPSGARALGAYLAEAYGRPLPMVVGVMRDKDVAAVIDALGPHASTWMFTAAENPRATPAAELVALAERMTPAVPAIDAGPPMTALARAAETVTGRGPVVVAGSLYLCGEIRGRIS